MNLRASLALLLLDTAVTAALVALALALGELAAR